MRDAKPDSLLPLPTAVFHILIALADRDRHGYSIMQDVAARTGGKAQLSAGKLTREQLEEFLRSEVFAGAVAKFGRPEILTFEVPAYVEQPAAVGAGR